MDLFDDETVSLTQSIQNVRDIAKIFTDFSKTFTLPASKNNNKIFKHYYNYDIDNGFDARTKKDAIIELNNLPFTNGKIKLEGVGLKNNKPNTYRITFFGSTVTLKDTIGEDKLSSLDLSAFNKTYSPSQIQSSLQADPASNDVIAPLITHTRPLYYDSSENITDSGNLYYQNSNHGVLWSDLKYAIRVAKVVEAIESKYGITFSDDFLTPSNLPYHNLFMWLHRKKGSVDNLGGLPSSLVTGFSDGIGADSSMTSGSRLNILTSPSNIIVYELLLTPATSDVYRVSVREDGIEVYNSGNITGSFSENNFLPLGIKNAEYTVYIESESSINFTIVEWGISYRIFPNPPDNSVYTGSFNYIAIFTFDISQQIPDMKVIDFITGVFRTFNLTAYVENDIIVVKTLDAFYDIGSSYDISKYIVSDSSSVNVALPFREINLEFEDTETILAKQHNQLAGKIWAKESYTSGEKLDGEIYNIKLPFSKVKYERLYNVDGGSSTTIQYGFFVDDNQDGYLGKPLLFYPIRQTSATAISFRQSDSNRASLTTYNIPSNSLSLNSATSKANINFFAEINEYTNTSDFTDTLFNVYYIKYISSVFNLQNRLTKVTAYLPLRILLKYTLADRFVINNRSFKINSINTNLNTGKSVIELLNDL